jgi:glucokinase-like ROK family protein
MTELVALAEAEAYARSRTVLGLGLGVPGLVDDANGTLLYAPNLKWENVPLRQIFAKRFSFPVTIDNEANLSALGESYFGAAKADTFVLFVSSGVGLGGGIVLDKQLLQSADGFTGEIGHMTMHPDGPLCACGNSGCWEMFASQKAVFRFVIEAMEGGKSTRLVSLIQAGQPLSIPAVLEAARDGDEVGLDALNRAGRWLGVGIANLVNALNPQVVVFGGILSTASDLILPVIRREVEQRALYWSRQNLRIERAQHGLDSCSLGGVAAIYHRILSQPNLGVVPALPVVEP